MEELIKYIAEDPIMIIPIIILGPIFYYAAKANEKGLKRKKKDQGE